MKQYEIKYCQMVLKVSQDSKCIKLYSKFPIQIFGDLDILVNLGFHEVDEEQLTRIIDPQLLKFLRAPETQSKISLNNYFYEEEEGDPKDDGAQLKKKIL